MKKSPVSVAIAALFTLSAATQAGAAVILRYNMGQASPDTQNAVTTAAGGNLTGGAGLSLTLNDFTGTYSTAPVARVNPNGSSSTTLSAAYTNNSTVKFTLTVGSAVTDLDLTSIVFDAARGGTGTPRGFGIRATSPTVTNEVLRGSTDIPTERSTFTNFNTPLTGFSSLQNLTAGQVVTFELGFFVPFSGNSIEFDNLIINGNATTLIPEPGSSALLALGSLGLLARRKRRH